jgi:hypothetical protein
VNGEGIIFLVIVGLIFAIQLLRWAVHKHRNKALGLPVNAELTNKYDPSRMPPPAVGDEPQPRHMGGIRMFGGGGWQPPTEEEMNQPGRDRD